MTQTEALPSKKRGGRRYKCYSDAIIYNLKINCPSSNSWHAGLSQLTTRPPPSRCYLTAEVF